MNNVNASQCVLQQPCIFSFAILPLLNNNNVCAVLWDVSIPLFMHEFSAY